MSDVNNNLCRIRKHIAGHGCGGGTPGKQVQARFDDIRLVRAHIESLEADKVRLDWLAGDTDIEVRRSSFGGVYLFHSRLDITVRKPTLREAIDAARKETP